MKIEREESNHDTCNFVVDFGLGWSEGSRKVDSQSGQVARPYWRQEMIKIRAVIAFNTGEEVKTSLNVEQVIDYAEKHGKKVSAIDRDENGQLLSAKFWDSSCVANVFKYEE